MSRNISCVLGRLCIIFMMALAICAAANIHPVQAEAKTTYKTVKVTKDQIKEKGAAKAIQAALDKAQKKATAKKPYKVVVPKGTYSLSTSLHIYSNTWLYARGVTFKQKSKTANMIRTGDSDDKHKGYYYKNITIEGATFNACKHKHTVAKIGHASNVAIKDCTFKNTVNAHLMEVAGTKKLTITNCKFKNQILKSPKIPYYEAVQIDIHEDFHFSGYKIQDIACKNIKIDKCSFTNVPRGVGSHTTVLNNPVNKISVTNCKFTDCSSCAIQGMNWINATIKNNTISGTPRGIAMYTVDKKGTYTSKALQKESKFKGSVSSKYKKLKDDQKIVISNNTITCGGKDPTADYVSSGITISGEVVSKKNSKKGSAPKGSYYISGVTVSNNTITTKGHGIRLCYAKKTTIENNTIKYNGSASAKTNYYGIQLTNKCKGGNKILNNTISAKRSNAVYVNVSSKASSIKNNTITSAGKDGIRVEGSSTVGTIKNNKISGAKNNGITFYDSASGTDVVSNTISSPKKYGIGLDKKSNVTNIESNTVKSPSSTGIFIYNKSKASKITGNTVSSAGKYGIGVNTNATATNIKNNTISSPKNNGIMVYDGSKSTTISGNKISDTGKYGIDADGSSVATNIKNNTISNTDDTGIFVYNGSTCSEMSGNKVTTTGKYGISANKKATVTAIKDNTISGVKTHGIFLVDNAKCGTISGNKISDCKERGISVNALKCALTISGNTISDCRDTALIFLNPDTTSYTITVKNNTLTGNGSVNGVQGTGKCKCSVSGNTIKNCAEGVKMSSSCSASVGSNTIS